MNRHLKHFRSDCSVNKLATERLFLYRWSELNSLAYLHIIDYRGKIMSSETIPWCNVPYKEDEVQKYSQTIIFNTYKLHILDQIARTDNILISHLIRSILHICNLFRNILNSDRKFSLYVDLMQHLYEKRFDDPTLFLYLWNLLCGSTNDTKINVLKHILEKHHDKKSVIMLNYVLNIAQAAHFNFWGVWFKENEDNYFSFCPVTLALLKGNVDHLALLMKYGFEQNCGRLAIYDQYYYNVENSFYSWLKAPLEEINPGRIAIVTEILLFLILISKTKIKSKRKSLIKGFRLLWSLNAVPFVTESELVDEVYRRFQNPPRRLRHRSFPTFKNLMNIVEFYDQVKPIGSMEDIRPRSLQQFCKCTIRKRLVRSYNLPQGIKELNVPKKLQEFLDV